MKESISMMNIFAVADHRAKLYNISKPVVVITTNGMTKRDGNAVMGRGIAAYAKANLSCADVNLLREVTGFTNVDKSTAFDTVLGRRLKLSGNQAYYMGLWHDRVTNTTLHVITMPTKNDWRDDSSISLIRKSATEMMALADTYALDGVFLPAPGCSNGRLKWQNVQPVIAGILDDRFTCVHPQI